MVLLQQGRAGKCLRYDGRSFQMSEEMLMLFDTMGSDKQRWIDSYSIVVECIYFELNHGGIAKEVVTQRYVCLYVNKLSFLFIGLVAGSLVGVAGTVSVPL